MSGEVEKEGVFTGRHVVNPFTGEQVPVWVANFVLGEYGTGAVMAVPAHDERDFEFARKYGLPIRVVVRPVDADIPSADALTEAVSNDGVIVNSGPWDGLPSDEARARMTADAKTRGIGEGTVQFRMKDWGISRQRYWGTPIPMVYCDKDGVQAVAGRPVAGRAAEGHRVHRPRRLAAGPGAGVRQHDVSQVRRTRASRDRHDGHVRGLIVVLRPLHRRGQRPAGVFAGQGEVLAAGRFLQRRRRTRDPAPDLLALLHTRVPRPRHGRPRRALHPVAHAGHGPEGRQGHVQVEGQRRRSGSDDREIRVGCAAALRDVCRAAGERGRVERRRARRQLSISRACVAPCRSLGRGDTGGGGGARRA